MSFDVASYFNHVYHHDLVNWFRELGAGDDDVGALGQMLREINSGRSVDCLPQGLYPSKMIGSDFLRFIDEFHGLHSSKLVRFMDDIYLFSNASQAIADDFQIIQVLLGSKGLSVNPQKTNIGSAKHVKLDRDIDTAKRELLKRRRMIIATGYDDDEEEVTIKRSLSAKEVQYLNRLLELPEIEEEDAELILTMMRDHARKVESRLSDIVRSFPNLTKNVYSFCIGVQDKEAVADTLIAICKDHSRLSEYQLFWFAAILDDHLLPAKGAVTPTKLSNLIDMVYNHQSATSITRAKILEIADLRFGLSELRETVLSNGETNWLGWAAAVGSRALKPGTRNHKLKYFAKGSPMNHLVAGISLKM